MTRFSALDFIFALRFFSWIDITLESKTTGCQSALYVVMKYKALVHAYNLFIYLFIHSFLLSFLHSFIYLFIYLFIHSFIYLISIHIIYTGNYIHPFTLFYEMCLGESRVLHWIVHPLLQTKFPWFETFVSFVALCLCVCVCVCVCVVCLFVLLRISVILSEQVNDFAFLGIF